MEIKICGITSAEDARVAREAGADFVGLILTESPRRVSLATAAGIRRSLGDRPEVVLLFRDDPLERVVDAVGETGARWVQLHGGESAEMLSDLREALPGVRVIKAWEVWGSDGSEALVRYLDAAEALNSIPDVLLLDAPKGEGHPGMEAFLSVALAAGARVSRLWCAGGLTPDNVGQLIASEVIDGRGRGGRLFDGVDVARGVELAPGRKDAAAVRRFVAAVRGMGWAAG